MSMVCSVEGEFMVRVGMMNPDTVAPVIDSLIEAYADPKVYKFIHLPLQSGSRPLLYPASPLRVYSPPAFREL